jgi:hypothetical protein
VPGKWSVLEVVCHLADTDANIAHRIKRILSEDRPAFDRVQPDLMHAALAYHERDVEEELTLFDLGRRQIARILAASPAEACERTGVVGDRGDWSVAQMVNGAVQHLAHHLAFVAEKRGPWASARSVTARNSRLRPLTTPDRAACSAPPDVGGYLAPPPGPASAGGSGWLDAVEAMNPRAVRRGAGRTLPAAGQWLDGDVVLGQGLGS